MREKNINIWYRDCLQQKRKVSGQIAVLFTLIIAVIFILVSITVNVGLVAKKKLSLDNTAETTAYYVASRLGSHAHALSQQFLDGGTEKAEVDRDLQAKIVLLIESIVVLIIGVIVLFFTGGFCWQIAAWGVLSTFTSAQDLYEHQQERAKLFEEINKYFKELRGDLMTTISESGMMAALYKIVDDPAIIADLRDDNRDGEFGDYDTNHTIVGDKVLRFDAWYAQRLRYLIAHRNGQTRIINNFLDQADNFKTEMLDSLYAYMMDDNGWWHLYSVNNILYNLQGIVNVSDDLPYSTKTSVLRYRLSSAWDTVCDLACTSVIDENGNQIENEIQRLKNRIDYYHGLSESDRVAQVSNILSEFAGDSDSSWYNKLGSWISGMDTSYTQAKEVAQLCVEVAMGTTVPEVANQCSAWADELRTEAERLTPFRGIALFHTDISRFKDSWRVFEQNYALDESRTRAIYSWKDKRGWHDVKVELTATITAGVPTYIDPTDHDNITPTIITESDTMKLRNYAGDVVVKVTRYDEDKLTYFARNSNRELWKFRLRNKPEQAVQSLSDNTEAWAGGIEVRLLDGNRKSFAEANNSINYRNPEYFLDNFGIAATAKVHWSYNGSPYRVGVN